MKPEQIQYFGPRIKTGAVQIGNDWPGLFIRGDDAVWLSILLSALLDGKPLDSTAENTIREYIRIIREDVTVQNCEHLWATFGETNAGAPATIKSICLKCGVEK